MVTDRDRTGDDMWAILMAMAQVGGGDCGRSCLAWGEAPRWSIRADGDRWSLHVAGRPPLMLRPGAWQDTPKGRRLTGMAANGRFTLVAIFGACGGATGDARVRSSHFATLTMADGQVLRGCIGDVATAY